MNAAIRAVVRTCVYYEKTAIGIVSGYDGLLRGDFKELGARDVSNIIHRGGTILKSARSEEFRTPEGRAKAFKHLQEADIDGLIAIGGNGTFAGAHAFYKEFGMPIIGIPGTIDNDLVGTDYTIGYDTATNTAVNAIDSIRDTASSHDRLFFIEVMGRDSGFIAVRSALATGAETMLIPEKKTTLDRLLKILDYGTTNKKTSSLVVVAEGANEENTITLKEQIDARTDNHYDSKVTILGHLQRGGKPTCFDRILASRMGVLAVEGLMEGQEDVMVGLINRKVRFTPLQTAINGEREIDEELLRVGNILAI